jgi:aspartate aminotransferase
MKLSKRISAVAASATLAVTNRAKQMKASGIDVIGFGAGEPDFDTPQFIKDAAKAALDAGDTKYMPRSAEMLKQAIAAKLEKENGIKVDPASQVVITFGGKHGLFDACQVLVDPGDKVLIPSPYWVSYPEMVKLAGGEPVFIPASRANGFKITPDQVLQYARDTQAKILILNSPSNPTSVTYSPSELKALADAVLQTDLLVFSDEIYEKLVYGDTKFASFASLHPQLAERTITFNGLSKTYAMTGWRLGWAAGPRDAIGAIKRLMSHETTDPVSFAVAGALAAYTSPHAPQAIAAMRKEFARRAQHMASRLNAMKGVVCVEPTGAFYCFPDVSAHYGRTIGGVKIDSSMTFTQAMLESAGIAVVPGDAFGNDDCVRLSFATSMEQIDAGLDRMEKALK